MPRFVVRPVNVQIGGTGFCPLVDDQGCPDCGNRPGAWPGDLAAVVRLLLCRWATLVRPRAQPLGLSIENRRR
jgi:hypothetical protein